MSWRRRRSTAPKRCGASRRLRASARRSSSSLSTSIRSSRTRWRSPGPGGRRRSLTTAGRGPSPRPCPAAGERARPGRPARPETAWRRARVLVVDDEPKVLATLAELLQSTGHTVIPAPSGAAALAAYAPGHFDAVLTNLGMAGMNGWEFAERLRAMDPNVAILFITGWGLRERDQDRPHPIKGRGCPF